MDPRFREYEEEKLRSLPAAGRRTQLFHLVFTEPGVHLLVHPCIAIYSIRGGPSVEIVGLR